AATRLEFPQSQTDVALSYKQRKEDQYAAFSEHNNKLPRCRDKNNSATKPCIHHFNISQHATRRSCCHSEPGSHDPLGGWGGWGCITQSFDKWLSLSITRSDNPTETERLSREGTRNWLPAPTE
ncbi:hypothetical protein KUCAC02_010110, partial [Chaenocephalus aceratus]